MLHCRSIGSAADVLRCERVVDHHPVVATVQRINGWN
jgi:hypothetical protein